MHNSIKYLLISEFFALNIFVAKTKYMNTQTEKYDRLQLHGANQTLCHTFPEVKITMITDAVSINLS